jgi:hypothetical protein
MLVKVPDADAGNEGIVPGAGLLGAVLGIGGDLM